jgi:putative membrane protein
MACTPKAIAWGRFYTGTKAVSASYELIEWAAAEMMGQGADAFLGTQGYAWDTQSDMLMALIGAIIAQVVLGKFQDGQLRGRAQ